MAAHGCSKAALKMLTRCMTREWAAYGIRVNAVGPTLTRTEFSKPIWSNPDITKMVLQEFRWDVWPNRKKLSGPFFFFVSNAANFITGHSIYVDGGTLTF